MAVQMGVLTRNARLDAIETLIGTSAVLTISTLAQAANCATADTGAVLASITLPSDWLAAASGGTKAIANAPWSVASATGTGTAGHFRISKAGVGEIQGSITTTAVGTGDMLLDNTSIITGQTVQISAFTLTDANA